MKFIEKIAPGWALSRAENRAKLEAYRRAADIQASYDGASRGRDTDGWTSVSGGSAIAETAPALHLLRNRSRDLVRNSWVGARAVDVMKNNFIGTGIRPSVDGDTEFEFELKRWARSTACDANGQLNLYGIQAQVAGAVFESGEALVLRVRERAGSKIPVSLRVLEGDYLDDQYNAELKNGNFIIQGVEYNSRGQRVAYHIFKTHPGDGLYYGGRDYVRVPAEDLLHVYEVLRPGQVRGIPAFAPIILKLRSWEDYETAQLVRQKIAACFTAFVRTDATELPGDADAGRPLGTKVAPGMIEILRPGENIEFGQPPGVDGYADYARVTLREIAAGLNIPYETLTTDLSGVNFSSARMGWLEFQRRIDTQRALLYEPRLLHPIADWALEAATLTGVAKGDEFVKWTPPNRQMIDPAKETKAALQAIGGGIKSRQEVIKSYGRDPAEVDRELAEDQRNADALGLKLSFDQRGEDPDED